jgi:feruloyl esterase
MAAGSIVFAGIAVFACYGRAGAATACDAGALSALAVDGVTIVSAAHAGSICTVFGTLNTSGGAPPGSAGFQLRLPDIWAGKFIFFGTGGFAGQDTDPSANPVDIARALAGGYAAITTDTGHQGGGTDASWALIRPGVPAEAKVADFLYRATHEITLAGKSLVQGFYGRPIRHAYFDGCSNGGHQGMTEAADYPADYDGIIAGAPFFDAHVLLSGLHFFLRDLSSPAAYVPAAKLPAINAAVLLACDAADGVKDGLIQNPAACAFDPASLICKGPETDACLKSAQPATVSAYVSETRDAAGHYVYAGASVTALTGAVIWSFGMAPPADLKAREPWGHGGFSPAPFGWQFSDHGLQFLVARQPAFDARSFANGQAGGFSEAGLDEFDRSLGVARTPRPSAGFSLSPASYASFLQGHGKLLLYHGLSDPAISPFSTMRLYEQMEGAVPGGTAKLQQSARLFLVPGMEHCGGGPGPNEFDTLTPLEQWVEHGVAPDAIGAVHHVGGDDRKPVDRGMKLCPFPRQAVYAGTGDVNDADSWACKENARMREVGGNGRAAGL